MNQRTVIMHLKCTADITSVLLPCLDFTFWQNENSTKVISKTKYTHTSNQKQSLTHWSYFYHYFCAFLHFILLFNLNMQSFIASIAAYVAYWTPNVSLRKILAMVLPWIMSMRILVIQHMKQRKSHMLNHFVCGSVINITSAFVGVVLLPQLFVEA